MSDKKNDTPAAITISPGLELKPGALTLTPNANTPITIGDVTINAPAANAPIVPQIGNIPNISGLPSTLPGLPAGTTPIPDPLANGFGSFNSIVSQTQAQQEALNQLNRNANAVNNNLGLPIEPIKPIQPITPLPTLPIQISPQNMPDEKLASAINNTPALPVEPVTITIAPKKEKPVEEKVPELIVSGSLSGSEGSDLGLVKKPKKERTPEEAERAKKEWAEQLAANQKKEQEKIAGNKFVKVERRLDTKGHDKGCIWVIGTKANGQSESTSLDLNQGFTDLDMRYASRVVEMNLPEEDFLEVFMAYNVPRMIITMPPQQVGQLLSMGSETSVKASDTVAAVELARKKWDVLMNGTPQQVQEYMEMRTENPLNPVTPEYDAIKKLQTVIVKEREAALAGKPSRFTEEMMFGAIISRANLIKKQAEATSGAMKAYYKGDEQTRAFFNDFLVKQGALKKGETFEDMKLPNPDMARVNEVLENYQKEHARLSRQIEKSWKNEDADKNSDNRADSYEQLSKLTVNAMKELCRAEGRVPTYNHPLKTFAYTAINVVGLADPTFVVSEGVSWAFSSVAYGNEEVKSGTYLDSALLPARDLKFAYEKKAGEVEKLDKFIASRTFGKPFATDADERQRYAGVTDDKKDAVPAAPAVAPIIPEEKKPADLLPATVAKADPAPQIKDEPKKDEPKKDEPKAAAPKVEVAANTPPVPQADPDASKKEESLMDTVTNFFGGWKTTAAIVGGAGLLGSVYLKQSILGIAAVVGAVAICAYGTSNDKDKSNSRSIV